MAVAIPVRGPLDEGRILAERADGIHESVGGREKA
jgi:hypothetical protein